MQNAMAQEGLEQNALVHGSSGSGMQDTIDFCLEHVGLRKQHPGSLVLVGTQWTHVPTARLWEVLEDVMAWPEWSPLHTKANWTGGRAFEFGATFDQSIDLGFPVGHKTESVEVSFVEPQHHVGWRGDAGGVRSCHLWRLIPAQDGRTQVCNVEAFSGWPITLVKPLVASRWRKCFQAAADGLVAAAEGRG